MSSIGFASSTKTLLKGAKTIAVIGAASVFNKRRFPKLLGKKLDGLAVELAQTIDAGDLGASATTLTGADPAQLGVGVLPDTVSRYNAASRAVSVHRVVGGLKAGKGKLAIILVVDDPAHILPQAIAVARCFPQFSGKSSGKQRRVQLFAVDRKGEMIKPDAGVVGTIAAVRDSAELVDTPPSELDPETFSARARAQLDGLDVEIEEIIGDDLVERGLGGIHAVGRAALSAPRLIIASYTPDEFEGQRHVALVGKGVTYDTGGLHLKPRGGMEGMKCDMGGAAAVLGAFRVLVQGRCRHRVSLLLCVAENAIGPTSYKPDDILTMHSGKTVEINNTDAEGRLLLADGVSWAARELQADTVINAATLTGAQLISTGVVHAGIVSNDAELEQAMVAAGQLSGDVVHPMLFAPELFKQEFSSQVADMCNSVRNRANAQSACAAQFVYNHLDGVELRWGHVDLAGPAFRKDRGTGYGVALLAALVASL
ncbi:M17 family metallopeptidase [Enhygromyxa salina]|uniref:Cytosol aminopeptidase n=1 Tax=Enhygromyxa salina TaxID=215803 RepID=A0A2S9XWS6_9BACT|nr:leucyl aminopeptidase family protein [Enhygromyxa salina]PRP97328.1 Cytosol aminopeptidase [Enhygromyxa salina]